MSSSSDLARLERSHNPSRARGQNLRVNPGDLPQSQKVRQLKPDDIVRWFFRLNGFLAMSNFIVHPPKNGGQRTDADVVGVRFPHHKELPFKDQQIFHSRVPLVAIAEVTVQPCKINGPWTNKDAKNMQYLLDWIGLFEDGDIEKVAKSLYDDCRYEGDSATVQMYAIGRSFDEVLTKNYPKLKQLTFESIFEFFYERFSIHRDPKANHQQWDETAQTLWKMFECSKKNQDTFVKDCLMSIGIKPQT